jgi:hypothetical protein
MKVTDHYTRDVEQFDLVIGEAAYRPRSAVEEKSAFELIATHSISCGSTALLR